MTASTTTVLHKHALRFPAVCGKLSVQKRCCGSYQTHDNPESAQGLFWVMRPAMVAEIKQGSISLLMSESPNAAVASLDHVAAAYGQQEVLTDICLRFPTGEVFALLGPNGAGKSSLIRVITGTLKPRSGAVVSDPRGIGLVPQDIALYPWLTPRENCLAFAGLDGLSRREAHIRVDEALLLTQCAAVAHTPVSRLSGGYQRRANIAVALMRAPSLLILDEPTAGLDADAKRVIRDVMLSIRATGAAVLLVTHEFDVAEAVADRVGILVAGRMVAQNDAARLLRDVFAGRRPVEIVLAGDPDSREIDALRAEDAVPSGSPRAWLLLRAPDVADVDALRRSLGDAGLRVREIRFREPTMADAYSVLTRGAAE